MSRLLEVVKEEIMRVLAAFCVAASLVPSITNARAEDAPPPHLEGAKAIQAITGMTISATGQHGPVVMFIGGDNSLDVWAEKIRSASHWSIKNDRFCIERENTCAKVDLYGPQGTFNYDGSVFPFTSEPGNQVAAHAAKG